ARQHAFSCEQRLLTKVAELIAYFRQPDYVRLPFEQVEYAARRYFDPAVGELLKLAYANAHLHERRAMDDAALLACKRVPAVYKQACDRQAAPYTLLAEAQQLGHEVVQARHWVKEAEGLRDRITEGSLHPFGLPSSGRATTAPVPSRPTSGSLLGGGRREKSAGGLTLNPL